MQRDARKCCRVVSRKTAKGETELPVSISSEISGCHTASFDVAESICLPLASTLASLTASSIATASLFGGAFGETRLTANVYPKHKKKTCT